MTKLQGKHVGYKQTLLNTNCTNMHKLLFSSNPTPSDTPNHYDSDCSSLRLPRCQSWPRFQQIIKMTSSSVFVCGLMHTCLCCIPCCTQSLRVCFKALKRADSNLAQGNKWVWSFGTYTPKKIYHTHTYIKASQTWQMQYKVNFLCSSLNLHSHILYSTVQKSVFILLYLASQFSQSF